MLGLKPRQRAIAVAAVLATLVSVTGAVTAGQAGAEPGARCGEQDFCLYARPNQQGRILFQRTVTVHDDGMVDIVSEDVVDPLIHPRSARLPTLPEGLSCIAMLFTEPHYDGDYQEIPYGYPPETEALSELNGQAVGSINTDCG